MSRGFVQVVASSGGCQARRCAVDFSGMPDIVTAAQLAADLDVNVKRLVRWPRAERESGHEVLAGRPPGARWAFPREHADRLAAEFTAAAARGLASDSAVQRKAEGVIRDLLAEHLGVGLQPREVKLAVGGFPDRRLSTCGVGLSAGRALVTLAPEGRRPGRIPR